MRFTVAYPRQYCSSFASLIQLIGLWLLHSTTHRCRMELRWDRNHYLQELGQFDNSRFISLLPNLVHLLPHLSNIGSSNAAFQLAAKWLMPRPPIRLHPSSCNEPELYVLQLYVIDIWSCWGDKLHSLSLHYNHLDTQISLSAFALLRLSRSEIGRSTSLDYFLSYFEKPWGEHDVYIGQGQTSLLRLAYSLLCYLISTASL